MFPLTFIHVFYYDSLSSLSMQSQPFNFNEEPLLQGKRSAALPSSGRYESDVIRRKWKRSSRPLSGKKEVEEELPPLSRRLSSLSMRSQPFNAEAAAGKLAVDVPWAPHVAYFILKRSY